MAVGDTDLPPDPPPGTPPISIAGPAAVSPSSPPSSDPPDHSLASPGTQYSRAPSDTPPLIDAPPPVPSPSPHPTPSPPPTPPLSPISPHPSLPPTSFPPGPSRSRRSSITRLAQADVHVNRNVAPSASTPQHERAASIAWDVLLQQLPSLCSPRPIRRAFARNLDTVVRGIVAFVVAAVVAVQPWSTEVLAVPYLAAMFTAGMVRPTVGSTLIYIDTQGKGVLAAAVIDVVIMGAQVPQLSTTNRVVAVEILLFFTSALLSYYFSSPMSRRFGLACHGLTLILVANGNTDVYLPFQIALCFFLSYAISFILVLVPFPRLAKDELLDRYQVALLTLSEVCTEVVQSYTVTEPIAPQVLHSTATSQLEDVNKSLTVMRRLQAESRVESEAFQWLFPASHSLASPIVADPDRLEQIYWIMSNLLHTLHTLQYNSYHATFVSFLREPFTAFAEAQADFLRALSTDQPSLISPALVDSHRHQLDLAMSRAWEHYSHAREFVYGMDETSQGGELLERLQEEERRRRKDSSVGGGSRRPSMNWEEGQEVALLTTTKTLIHHPAAAFHRERTRLHHTTNDIFHRSCFFFYLNRYHNALMSADFHFPSSSTSTDPTATPPSSTPQHAKRHVVSSSIAHHVQHPLTWSLLGFHPILDALHLVRTFAGFVRHPAVDVDWLKASIKVALIMCVSSLIAVIPQLTVTDVFPNALWATFTAAVLVADSEGALWQRGIHRLLGTFVGGAIGYFILWAVGYSYLYGILLLSAWSVPTLFVQSSRDFSYLGTLAQLTPIVVVLGYQVTLVPESLTPERFAFARIEEICIGVIEALLISSLLWPVSSIRLLRSEIMLSVASFRMALDKSMKIYESMAKAELQRKPAPSSTVEAARVTAAAEPADAERKEEAAPFAEPQPAPHPSAEVAQIGVAIHEEDELLRSLLSSSASVQMSLSRQSRLLTEAVNEPAVLFTTFPADAYRHIGLTQRRVWCLVLTIQPALEQLLQRQRTQLLTPLGPSSLLREEMFDVAGLWKEMKGMMSEVDRVLGRCTRVLEDGRGRGGGGGDGRGERVIVKGVQGIEREFARSLNDLSRKVREGRASIVSSETIVPIAVFLYAAVQLAEQTLILDAALARLIQLEQPKAYDD